MEKQPVQGRSRLVRRVPRVRASDEIRTIFRKLETSRAARRSKLRPPLPAEKFQGILQKLQLTKRELAKKEYYRILDTFAGEKGSGLPWPLTPSEVALQGWEFFAPGIVRCSYCKRHCFLDLMSFTEIFVGLSQTDQNMRAWIIEEFRKQMLDPGHDVVCSRPTLPFVWELNQFACFTYRSFRDKLMQRLKSLVILESELPVLEKAYPGLFPPDVLLKTAAKLTSAQTQPGAWLVTAVLIALHGWAFTDVEKRLIGCEECGRKVDISKFCPLKRKEILEDNERSDFQSDMFSGVATGEDRFDCAKQHFGWCPWVRPVELTPEKRRELGVKGSDELTGAELAVLAFKKEYVQTLDFSTVTAESLEEEAKKFRILLEDTKNEMMSLQQKILSQLKT